jgi:predicted MFS family arabinose efflux permease
MRSLRRNIPILTAAQAFGVSGVSMFVFLGGLVGTNLSPIPTLATLPVSIMVIGVACSTIPASAIMKRIGRRWGFIIALFVATAGMGTASAAIIGESFALFCIAAFMIGFNGAFVQQYRFAAIESVEPSRASRAVSSILIGGIIAGFLGPELGSRGRDWIEPFPFVGSLVGMAVLYLVTATLMFFLTEPERVIERKGEPAGSLGKIVKRPSFLVSVCAAMVSYGVMSFLMTATPISMHRIDGYEIEMTARVIQAHVIAMYLPSLFSGLAISRWGVFPVALTGVGLMALSAVFAISGHAPVLYAISLIALGIGWNFLFVGGTTLLASSYRPEERFKAQATNDFIVFGTQSIASLTAGQVLFRLGWHAMGIIVLPVLLLTGFVLVLHRFRSDDIQVFSRGRQTN